MGRELVVSCPEDFQSRVAWGLRDISEKAVEFIGVGQEAPLADYEEFSSNYGLANAHKETTGAVPGQIQHARDRIGKLGNGAANRGGGEPEREYEFKRRDTPDEGSFVMDSDDEE
ncbi:hypothetical protein EES43_08005 [Streptomyces sp. ADI96-02]|uniref:hypothetical protein n=1 Tax=Streptomyces sp. ADI96-02 TaxID=1522760 RepID=UPI000F551738|nr:hypothetical protein [Streptomyces sp. ADI96-02]RPK65440.1 hypothetical protein EES43_08005 [Streptomyces sp. ADI96-02]